MGLMEKPTTLRNNCSIGGEPLSEVYRLRSDSNQKMKYKFENYNYLDERDNINKSTSIILIENEENYGEHFSTEIKNIKLDYLNKIVISLEQVLSGELEHYPPLPHESFRVVS